MTSLQAYLQNSKTRKVLSKKPGSAGFSLIELVVVVAVLAILAAIAIPAFGDAQTKSRESAAKTALAAIYKECEVSEALSTNATGAHQALATGNGVTFSNEATATTCAGASLATAAATGGGTYTINLSTGVKTGF